MHKNPNLKQHEHDFKGKVKPLLVECWSLLHSGLKSFSVFQHGELLKEALEECVMEYFERCWKEDSVRQHKNNSTKSHLAAKCFQSTSLRSIKRGPSVDVSCVWMQPFDVSCYIKWHRKPAPCELWKLPLRLCLHLALLPATLPLMSRRESEQSTN